MGKFNKISLAIISTLCLLIGQSPAFAQLVGGGNGNNGGLTINDPSGRDPSDGPQQMPGLNPGVCEKEEVFVKELGENIWVNTGKCCVDEGKPGNLLQDLEGDNDDCSVPVSQSSEYDFMEGCSTVADCPPPFVLIGRCENSQCVQESVYVGDSSSPIPTNECYDDAQCTHQEIRYLPILDSGSFVSSTTQRAISSENDPSGSSASSGPASPVGTGGSGPSVNPGSKTPSSDSIPKCVPVPNTAASGTYDQCKYDTQGWHAALVDGVCQAVIGEGAPECPLKDSNGQPLCGNEVLDKGEACEFHDGSPEYAYLDGGNKVCVNEPGNECQWADVPVSALSCTDHPTWVIVGGGKKGHMFTNHIPDNEKDFQLDICEKGAFYHVYKGISPSNLVEDSIADEDKSQILEVSGKKTNIAYRTPGDLNWQCIPKKKKKDDDVNPEQLLLWGSTMTSTAYNNAGLDVDCAVNGNCLVRLVAADKKLGYEKFSVDTSGDVELPLENMRSNVVKDCKGKVDQFGECITLPFPKIGKIRAVASNGKDGIDHRFVAVGDDSQAVVSYDGIDWQIINTGIPGTIFDLLYNPGDDRWVAAGEGGLISTVTTPNLGNGLPWAVTNTLQTGENHIFYGLTYSPTAYCPGAACTASNPGSPLYIAVGTNNSKIKAIFYSQTGIPGSWIKANVSGTVKGDFQSVACNNKIQGQNKCRAVTDEGYVIESANGKDWGNAFVLSQKGTDNPTAPNYTCAPALNKCPKSPGKLYEIKYFDCN